MTADLRRVAAVRAKEARALLDAGLPSGAYYLAGYSIECGLKAVIVGVWLGRLGDHGLPPKAELVGTYIHDLTKLLKLAGLESSLASATGTDSRLRDYWEIAKDWNEASRYEIWSQREAEEMVAAVSDVEHGVLQWLQTHW